MAGNESGSGAGAGVEIDEHSREWRLRFELTKEPEWDGGFGPQVGILTTVVVRYDFAEGAWVVRGSDGKSEVVGSGSSQDEAFVRWLAARLGVRLGVSLG
jgi:hypothetical protein